MAPAPIPHQYIGTVIDNTIGLLTAPANALDDGMRRIEFGEDRAWLSLMGAVHRSFLSSMHLATEAGLIAICRGLGVEIKIGQNRRITRIVQTLSERVGRENILDILDDLESLKQSNPEFGDYLTAALNARPMTKRTRASWQRYFKALSIFRNKVSHSDSGISTIEKQQLMDGGFDVIIAADGSL